MLSSPRDTAASTLLARLSTPVRHLADTGVPMVALDDRVEELRRLLLRGNAPGALALDRDGRMAGVVTKTNLLRPSALKLILVDHNELSQAVPGADQVEILEVIDHHRLGNFHTDLPIRFINQPLGSTCSVVATLFRQAALSSSAARRGAAAGRAPLRHGAAQIADHHGDRPRTGSSGSAGLAGREPSEPSVAASSRPAARSVPIRAWRRC